MAKDDRLNIRAKPSGDAAIIGEMPADADGIANFGCRGGLSFAEWQKATPEERDAAARSRWCRVGYGEQIGWAAGRFLSEGSDAGRFKGGAWLADLAGTEWTLRDFAGEAAEAKATITFGEEGRATGLGGCNRFNSGYTVEPGRLSFGPVAATRMACPDPMSKVERRFFEVLEATSEFVATENLMAFFSGDQELLATFSRGQAPE